MEIAKKLVEDIGMLFVQNALNAQNSLDLSAHAKQQQQTIQDLTSGNNALREALDELEAKHKAAENQILALTDTLSAVDKPKSNPEPEYDTGIEPDMEADKEPL